jgi:hypothetical protein
MGWFTPTGDQAGHVRPHLPKNLLQVQNTLNSYKGRASLLEAHLKWFETLPLWIETDEYRAVHAAWCPEMIDYLKGLDPQFRVNRDILIRYHQREQPLYRALETTLKGPEVKLPDNIELLDADGTLRREMRIAWWKSPNGASWRHLSVKTPHLLPEIPFPESLKKSWWGNKGEDKPVVFGHYSLDGPPHLLTHNVICTDFKDSEGNVAAACRFKDGLPVFF